MTIHLKIPDELEGRLLEEARRRGLGTQEYIIDLLTRHAPSAENSKQLVELLQSWIDSGDAVEQKETGDYLVRSLDEDRLSNRKLFPPELEGVTW